MADERYQWLDQEAAERLLRGEPVDAVDDHTRSRAERLAEALDAARTPTLPPAARTELQGEAAALAAFRAARAERAAGPAAAPVASAAASRTEQAELGRVRLAPVPAGRAPVPAGRPRWGRSLRYGLAAAVAAVTVGGVAVAAGTGVLPMVGGPAPASSVTAGEHADPLVSEDPGIRRDPEAPSTEPGGDDRTPTASPSSGTVTTPPSTGTPDGHGTGTQGSGTPKPDRTTSGTGTAPGGSGGETGGKDGGAGGTDGTGGDPSTTTTREKVLKACRAFRSGQLDATGRKGLMNILRDGETLRRYCDRILGGTSAPQDGGSGGDDSKDGSDDDPKGDGNDRGSGDGRGGDRDGWNGDSGRDRRDTARSSAPDTAGLTAVPPLGIGVGARVPLPV
ncbi:hypothetical protein ACFQ64_09705 [Streptomyces sp. NPDC056460]|uniref:hypothetical protein n=1 Tax=Streptomyces sp. NPDC056460 TaxID=3345825 RepID=UPI0036833ACF